jgi:hypothetical protein
VGKEERSGGEGATTGRRSGGGGDERGNVREGKGNKGGKRALLELLEC